MTPRALVGPIGTRTRISSGSYDDEKVVAQRVPGFVDALKLGGVFASGTRFRGVRLHQWRWVIIVN